MRRTNRRALTAAVAILALATAACGGATGSAPQAEAAPTTEVAASPAADNDGTSSDDHAGDSTDVAVDRTVEIEMSEFAFTPADLSFEAGETVRFVFTNVGEASHEAVLGDRHVQEEHETTMAEGADDHSDNGEDPGGHQEDIPSVTVEPGETGEFVHTFTEPGELMLGCHLPGHWDAGMQATLEVAA